MAIERPDSKSSTHYRENDPTVRQALDMIKFGPPGDELYRVGQCTECGVTFFDYEPKPKNLCTSKQECAARKEQVKLIDAWAKKHSK